MAEKTMQAITNRKYHRAYDYRTLIENLSEMAASYQNLELGFLGTTVLDRPIPVVTIGQSKHNRSVLYMGGIHGTDMLTSAVLLRFVCEYADFLESGKRMYNVNLPYLFENRTIHVVPMLNPDGYEIRRYGAVDEVVRDRLLKQNGSEDFRDWRGNARGVDLWRNFTEDAGAAETADGIEGTEEGPAGTAGLSPESEPETSALCNYLRIFDEISTVLSLHVMNGAIRFYTSGSYTPRSRTLARLFSRMTGCVLGDMARPPLESGQSLTDWFIHERNKPAFECGCLTDENIDPSDPEDYIKVYAAFREALFSAPLLI
ncbi:MAG: M14 family zinc carboxypeptidase [Eubacteriales bacterium]